MDLTKVAAPETVQEYMTVIQGTDIKTGIIALAILVLGLVLVHLVIKAAGKGLQKSHIPKTLHTMIRTLLRIFLIFIVLLTVGNYVGLPITPFITMMGLFGLALSLALQGVLNNLAGGFLILSSHPFEVGHFIEQDGITGTVREIRLQHTRLETPDGKMIYIPNSSISASRVINYSETGKRRAEISVSASYNNSPEQVRAAIMSVIAKTEGILQDPAPVISLEKYGDSAIEYLILIWVNGSDFIQIKREVTEKLYTAFREYDVEMTYPHLNVHMQ